VIAFLVSNGGMVQNTPTLRSTEKKVSARQLRRAQAEIIRGESVTE
jgi:hypothetical protein